MGNRSSKAPTLMLNRTDNGNKSSFKIIYKSEHETPAPTLCVVCATLPISNPKFVTCSIECTEKLCKEGPPSSGMCNYCHRKQKSPGANQCSSSCENSATIACLLCKSRPQFKRSYLCGKTCVKIASEWLPYLILELPSGHVIYNMVEKKFIEAWKYSGTITRPPIKKIYKIVGTKNFFDPYTKYKNRVGNEKFSYHGTTKTCNLGSSGNTQLCSSNLCRLCSILRTSFKTSFAKSESAQPVTRGYYRSFGPGIYTSTASNKAYNYTDAGRGAMIVTSMALGKVFNVNAFAEVQSCPVGFDSVVFNRGINGSLNETIVYDDDAIRPVYLIFF